MKKIVTVQDISCYGQCSLTVALPVISALGIETAVVPTAILSNHSGICFDDFTFSDFTEEIPSVINQWKNLGLKFDAVYSGYLGNKRQTEIVKELFNVVKKENTMLFVDPVMADNGEFYQGFDNNFVQDMKRLCEKADVICPNITEACFLTETPYKKVFTESEIIEIIKKCSFNQTQKVVITGIPSSEKSIATVCYDTLTEKIDFLIDEKIEGIFHGTGDIFASVLFGLLLKDYTLEDATKKAGDFCTAVIKNTVGDKEHFYGVHFEDKLSMLTNL